MEFGAKYHVGEIVCLRTDPRVPIGRIESLCLHDNGTRWCGRYKIKVKNSPYPLAYEESALRSMGSGAGF